jgi:uncharacterized protein YacL
MSNTTSIVLTGGFLCATLVTTFYDYNINKDLKELLTPKEKIIYQEVVNKRRNIYYTGLILGVIIACIFLYLTKSTNYYYKLFSAISITFFINYFYYILYPKPLYMLEILDTNKENKAWLKIYRYMQIRYHLGFLFGLCFAFFLYKSIIS